MGKVAINESTLSAIGSAIREMTGKSDLIAPAAMPNEIRSIETGGADVEPVVLTGDCEYACSGILAGSYINNHGKTISTKDITYVKRMFNLNTIVEKVPFDINITANCIYFNNAFDACVKLKEPPKIIGPEREFGAIEFEKMFYNCQSIRDYPEDYFRNIVPNTQFWTDWHNAISTYGNLSNLFSYNTSARRLPDISMLNGRTADYYSIYRESFRGCYALDELVNVPVADTSEFTSNVFYSTVENCCRLKNFVFSTQNDGTPYVVNWKNQTIELNSVGYAAWPVTNRDITTNYNSGITTDKEVKNADAYQALKNDPDWFATKVEYSRYNHDSAVNTINSLPDSSTYGTNTIIFKGTAGQYTDGGAINTLTEAEIAVAAAKGWTVSFV